MKLERLPTSSTEKPILLGMYDKEKNQVVWAVDSEVLYDSPQFMDGRNWFSVWRIDNMIHCQVMKWYHSRGDFCVRVTDLTPEEAVAMASQSTDLASEYFFGDKELDKTS